ncbi:hypothetical protein [Nesterenkonia pannonica]|nr:hypothetical protein [Nesterenkonia pannonica]
MPHEQHAEKEPRRREHDAPIESQAEQLRGQEACCDEQNSSGEHLR